jgi:diguanylate cyclase (GGDEF)-like protein
MHSTYVLQHVPTPKVLLVNDDAASLFALESLLMGSARTHEYELLTAASGSEALRQVLIHEFAVILLDIRMPGMDGFETAEAIHSHPRSSSVPIIFITAYYSDEMHRLQAYQKGAADYIFTPVIPQILQSKVAVFVDMARKSIELQAKTAELSRLYDDLRVQRLQELERANRELEQEVAERKLAEARAHDLAIHDPLTGLVNRGALIAQLELAVARADRQLGECALLYLDIDRFGHVNDTLGHACGDELLRQMATRLRDMLRVSDVAARLGGDVFVILLEGKGAHAYAARVARKIEQAHRRVFDIHGNRLSISSNIGIAMYPQDGPSAAVLLRNAEKAMAAAKTSRAGIEFFRDALTARENERASWAEELRRAIDERQLELRYQPRASVATGELTALEAVLHWRHPRHGLLAADHFLADVGDTELLARLNDWTINHACIDSVQWPELRISVSLLAAHLAPGLAHRVLNELRRNRVAHGRLEFEIHEQQLLDGRYAQAELRQLADAGVGLAVDDFGSASSSLLALRELPLTVLKIDRSFIRAIGNDHGGTDMVAAMIHLGRALRQQVVAQGVDSFDQLTILRTLGCDQYQGELYSEPLTIADMHAFLEAGHEAQHLRTSPKQRGLSR